MITPFKLQAKLFATIFILLSITYGCSRDKFKAQKPVFLSLPQIELETTLTEGTSHNKITTAFVYLNGATQGVYEMPATFPVLLKEGKNEILIYSGINLNGNSSQRALYEAYTPLRYTFEYYDNGTEKIDTINHFNALDNRTTTINPNMQYVEVIEDFDQSGTNFSSSTRSDTLLMRTDDPEETFTLPGEDNGKAGKFIFGGNRRTVEAVTVDSYVIPRGVTNVYLEFSYKCNIPIQVGVISQYSTVPQQNITAIINPKSDWNKIYINVITEIDGNRDADSYKFYFGAVNSDNLDTAKIYVDNIKLVY